MLCRFANEFPLFVGSFLDRETHLKRYFREETITDLMMGALVAVGAPRVIVQFPYEPTTGADMEWNFVSPGRNTFFRILLQAKRLTGNGNIWTRYVIVNCCTDGFGNRDQVQVLCDTAQTAAHPTYPLYAFFHPARVYDWRIDRASVVAGVTWQMGRRSSSFFWHCATEAASVQEHRKRVSIFFPLSALLCSSAIRPILPYALSAADETMGPFVIRFSGGQRVVGIPLPPTPEIVRETLVRQHSASIDARETTETHAKSSRQRFRPSALSQTTSGGYSKPEGARHHERKIARCGSHLRLVKPSGFSINVGFPYRCLLDIMSV